MLRLLVTRYISAVKKIDYVVDENISNMYILKIILSKATLLLRGLIKIRRLVFIGRRVEVNCKKLLTIGNASSIGDYCIVDCLSVKGVKIGRATTLGRFGKIRSTATLVDLGYGVTIGECVGIGDGFYLGAYGGIDIGSDTIIGERLTIHSDNHKYKDSDLLIREQGVVSMEVEIGSNCWIGSNVTILGGVKIGSGCIVGAGSIVTKSFPENCIIVGCPAKVLTRDYHKH